MIPTSHDKPLFTPGPLSTSRTVKQAMLRDLGSRDAEFIRTVHNIREGLLELAGVSRVDGYEAVLIQGSGTFVIEAVLSSCIPPRGKMLAVVNGAYGERIRKIAEVHGIETIVLRYAENELPRADDVDRALAGDPSICMLAVVHCETTSGIVNPVAEIGRVVRSHNRTYFVDSMSAFGAVEFDFARCGIDFLVSSANKCIEGVPGFGFVLCRRDALLRTEGWARTVSLDLVAQWRGLESNGQFRFTPPTHAILAFEQALRELKEEGGVAARADRYRLNHACVANGMRELGFEEYVPAELQGYIITSFLYPDDPRFEFEEFYRRLNEKGFVIYPGKVTDADCFRIGHIGRLFESDMRALLAAIREVLSEMGVA
jgi:2-aminoethylphosphonate-pyruvate transaminase